MLKVAFSSSNCVETGVVAGDYFQSKIISARCDSKRRQKTVPRFKARATIFKSLRPLLILNPLDSI
jgi:hypothetical protein